MNCESDLRTVMRYLFHALYVVMSSLSACCVCLFECSPLCLLLSSLYVRVLRCACSCMCALLSSAFCDLLSALVWSPVSLSARVCSPHCLLPSSLSAFVYAASLFISCLRCVCGLLSICWCSLPVPCAFVHRSAFCLAVLYVWSLVCLRFGVCLRLPVSVRRVRCVARVLR
jgi:hypothetical protein